MKTNVEDNFKLMQGNKYKGKVKEKLRIGEKLMMTEEEVKE